MAGSIKGITVEIGGDTTGLSKALAGINKNITNTQKQQRICKRPVPIQQLFNGTVSYDTAGKFYHSRFKRWGSGG